MHEVNRHIAGKKHRSLLKSPAGPTNNKAGKTEKPVAVASTRAAIPHHYNKLPIASKSPRKGFSRTSSSSSSSTEAEETKEVKVITCVQPDRVFPVTNSNNATHKARLAFVAAKRPINIPSSSISMATPYTSVRSNSLDSADFWTHVLRETESMPKMDFRQCWVEKRNTNYLGPSIDAMRTLCLDPVAATDTASIVPELDYASRDLNKPNNATMSRLFSFDFSKDNLINNNAMLETERLPEYFPYHGNRNLRVNTTAAIIDDSNLFIDPIPINPLVTQVPSSFIIPDAQYVSPADLHEVCLITIIV